jgi:hypothetical protein
MHVVVAHHEELALLFLLSTYESYYIYIGYID